MMSVISNIERNQLTWQLPDSISSNILDLLIDETKKEYAINKDSFGKIILDFSKTKFMDPEGAMYLICFCAAIKRKNRNTNFHFVYPSEKVLNYLISLGFFGQMSNKVGINERQDIIKYENELKHRRKLELKKYRNKEISSPIILPISTIEQRDISLSSRMNFENMVGSFVNNSLDTFNNILIAPEFNLSGEDYYQFRESNVELFKNIFHHSKSWGIATIYARPNFGTSVCYFDIGVGFKSSIGKFNTELESIEWALIDGNTSQTDPDNDGLGLTLVQEFVLKRKGNLKIRCGDCVLQLNSDSRRKTNKVSNFHGVQISYFIPV